MCSLMISKMIGSDLLRRPMRMSAGRSSIKAMSARHERWKCSTGESVAASASLSICHWISLR